MKPFLVSLLLAGLCWIPGVSSQVDQTQAPRIELVAVVGCIARDWTKWFVTDASGPLFAPSLDWSRETGQWVTVEMAREQVDGTLRYRLIGALEHYSVPMHEGHRALARGLLIEDDNETRLNVTAVVMVEPTCAEEGP